MKPSSGNIIPHLWFDKEVSEATGFYTSIFPDSGILSKTEISGTPSGDVEIITFKLYGQTFMAINGGPLFPFNQALSFFVYCGSDAEINRLYKLLSEGGSVIMPLGKYEWSPKYAWIKDKFGLSWQLDIDDIKSRQKIVPVLLFANEKSARVKEAITFYSSVFPESRILMEFPYDNSSGMPDGALLFAQFKLSGFIFNSMSSTLQHDFDFNEAVSFIVNCNNQEEIDYYWNRLGEGGMEQQCGWLKDKFGVSWQIVPSEMNYMMSTSNKKQLARVTAAMLKMVKLDIGALKSAYNAEDVD